MLYIVPIAVVLLGFAADVLVEISAELSSDVLVEADAGVSSHGSRIVGGNIVDMRPETSLSGTVR
ncbi:hypothetical protein Snov_2203 [Ancylobacter novellus DSM 506]|uniref:Uncharacterized protein n=1 Tax=Ancylobacter novellus (strain ATCC 8093 / DSM 506 / JCM 20403 / CCM 1077 / IAM 12100 / NBRC 12443 / NCIMB 10456) TaxID=639283 RepID=D7A1E1_ANCN5|nr:hypothetical protein [Ancylobacter novellus]ADH89499.1 hypothetical protein Snov_2203 [Ancylobacter novellus DSM 506]